MVGEHNKQSVSINSRLLALGNVSSVPGNSLRAKAHMSHMPYCASCRAARRQDGIAAVFARLCAYDQALKWRRHHTQGLVQQGVHCVKQGCIFAQHQVCCRRGQGVCARMHTIERWTSTGTGHGHEGRRDTTASADEPPAEDWERIAAEQPQRGRG